MKNIILGIDGGCLEFILPLVKQNLLPNFKKLIDMGFSSPLRVSVPPVTIPSWPCLFSGLTPKQLKYYWFEHPKKGLFNSKVWSNNSIFSLIKGKHFVLNVPGTYPAWKIKGEMIAGMMSPKINCFPLELNFFINKDWIIDGNSIRNNFKAFEMKSHLFLRKMEEDFNLMTYVIRLPDSLSHHSHLDRRLLINYINLGYKKIDDFIGEIFMRDFDNIFVFSDHGLKFYNYEFNMRRWLEKKGLLFINNSKGKKIYSIFAKIFDNFRGLIKINYEKYHLLKTSILKNLVDDSISLHKKINGNGVLSFFGNSGAIFLDKRNEDKKLKILKKMKEEKRIKKIYIPNIEGFPDFIVVLDEKYIFSHESSYFIIRGRNTINHSQFGLFLAYGKNIKKGKSDLVDYKEITPTILKLHNTKKPHNLMGNTLDIL